jgi:hypothetical protein
MCLSDKPHTYKTEAGLLFEIFSQRHKHLAPRVESRYRLRAISKANTTGRYAIDTNSNRLAC